MMPEFGKYAAAVLSAYGVSLGILALLIFGILRRNTRALHELEAAESQRDG